MKTKNHRTLALVALFLGIAPQATQAQWIYPGGYGNYGWGGWGADPHSGYMAGLGAYAQGKGLYDLNKAKADAIHIKTVIEWNKALQARKRALKIEQAKEDAKLRADAVVRTREQDIENGTTLNDLLDEVLEFNAGKTEAYLSKVPLSGRLLREISFEPATEPITLCIDQLTAKDAVPNLLQDPKYDAERQALVDAVQTALKEDTKGTVTPKTQKSLVSAVDAFRKKFQKLDEGGDEGSLEADQYLRTVASLSRLLQDSSMKQAIGLLESYEKGNVGDLLVFMEAYNLRFAPATSREQKEIYINLVPLLVQVRDKVAKDETLSNLDKNGKPLQTAARKVFSGMTWDQLDAQAKQNN